MSAVGSKRKLRYEDYVQFPDDGMQHEILDGEHFVTPSPNLYHQDILLRLSHELHAALQSTGLAKVVLAPFDVELSEHNLVQPDIIVVLPDNRIITPNKIKGAPDLLVEILSPSNRDYDREDKRDRYEAAGVREYWIVDPDEHEVEQLVLGENGKYAPREHDAVVKLSILDDISVDFRKVW